MVSVTVMPRRIRRSTLFALLGTLVGLLQSPVAAQLAGGPWDRFMGNGFSNGASTYAGPSSTPSSLFSVTSEDSVPAVSSGGKVVVAGGTVSCYNGSTGSKIWSSPTSPMFWSYGSVLAETPAIGSGNNVYVVATKSVFGQVQRSLVALDLNATGPSSSVNWACTVPASGPQPTGSPVVGPDNTVYTVDAHSTSSPPSVFAFKQGSSFNSTTNLKWRWDHNSVYTDVQAGIFGQPIIWVDNSTNPATTYIIVSGYVSFGIHNGNQSGTIRTIVLRDDGTGATVMVKHDFPFEDATNTSNPPRYQANGAVSLSPDGTSLLVPYRWIDPDNTSNTRYGLTCVSVSLPGTVSGFPWSDIDSDVNNAPTGDVTNPSSPITFSAAIDPTSTYVCSTTANGTTLKIRNLSNGSSAIMSDITGVNGAQLPAFDTNGAIWVATSDGYAKRYNLSGSLISSVSVSQPVNGVGLAIGASNRLYLTTRNSSTGALLLIGLQ